MRQYPWKPGERTKIDLTKIKIPVLAINGEFDGPNAKTHRMQRELVNFKSVVLPGKSHLTAIMPGYIPKEYIADAGRIYRRERQGGVTCVGPTSRRVDPAGR